MDNNVTLPQWLDDFIFDELGAKYCRSNADMTVIDWDKGDILNYLGTYFPRSYAESYCIFGDCFDKGYSKLLDKDSLSIFDFGCGTGGEIVGLIIQLKKCNVGLRNIKLYALDGNYHALRICDSVVENLARNLDVTIEFKPIAITIDDFYDLSILDGVLKGGYDLILTFKAICEFVTKERFEKDNAYEHIIKTMLPKLLPNGIMLVVDVTSYSDVGNEWLPRMMDKAIMSLQCHVIHTNDGYNQSINVSHSHQKNDVSKVAWRMITHKMK